jgi:putative hydrolase of the HAD superfamily
MISLSHVDTWIFDLDNTLYPPSIKLFEQIAARMNEMIMARMGLSLREATQLRQGYFKKYGTTLRGLMMEHGWEPTAFLDYVHEIDYGPVEHHPALGEAIAALPGRKLIFTAGTRPHARNVLARLGCAHVFEEIFDISDCHFIPKPDARPYEIFLKRHGVTPDKAAFFEDLPENLLVPRALGMVTVLVGEHDAAMLPAHVDYVTDDLAEFLQSFGAKD